MRNISAQVQEFVQSLSDKDVVKMVRHLAGLPGWKPGQTPRELAGLLGQKLVEDDPGMAQEILGIEIPCCVS